ncbi:unnamed protein product [Acanthosepion pharaonis]|uniref:Uncharacterized protein n=1 Tax=Acanthosepion pharaonis TaxID=158019 RepID=A0A812DZB5_ACAPH|nr:unnamed protein product [Sepia pharaonis]
MAVLGHDISPFKGIYDDDDDDDGGGGGGDDDDDGGGGGGGGGGGDDYDGGDDDGGDDDDDDGGGGDDDDDGGGDNDDDGGDDDGDGGGDDDDDGGGVTPSPPNFLSLGHLSLNVSYPLFLSPPTPSITFCFYFLSVFLELTLTPFLYRCLPYLTLSLYYFLSHSHSHC